MSITEPKQARSRKTLEQIVAASQALLDESTFEEISMQAIAERAGVSVGNLYNRFSGKEALITHLIERMQAQQSEFVGDRLRSGPGKGRNLRARLAYLAETIDSAVKVNAGLIRAIAARNLAGRTPQTDLTDQNTRRFVTQMADWVYQSGDEVSHPDPRQACRFAVASIAFGLQYALIFDTPTRLFGANDYKHRLAEGALAYLTGSAGVES